VSELKYLGTNRSEVHNEIKRRINDRNACYYSFSIYPPF